MRLLLLCAALCGLWLLVTASVSPGQSVPTTTEAAETRQLTLGVAIEDNLSATGTHRFQIQLDTGEVAVVKVNQVSLLLNVAVLSGEQYHHERVAGWDGKTRIRPVVLSADQPTTYVLVLTATQSGRYTILLETQRPATETDRHRLSAFEAFQAAQKARKQNTKEGLQAALKQFQQALTEYEAAQDTDGTTETLVTLGILYDNLGETQRAIACYERALPLRKNLGEPFATAQVFNNLARAYDNAGEKRRAVEYYRQAISLADAAQDAETGAVFRTNLAYTLDILGEKQAALDLLEEAIALARQAGHLDCEGDAINNQGLVYESLGLPARAQACLEQAITLYRQLNNRRSLAVALTNLARIHSKQNNLTSAQSALEEALPLRRAVGDKRGEAYTLTLLGELYLNREQFDAALRSFEEAMRLRRETGDRRGEGITAASLATTYDRLGRLDQAEANFNLALQRFQSVGDRAGEANVLYQLAKLHRAANDLTAARTRIEQAVAIAESLRTNVASQELRSAYFASVKNYYDLYIDVLMQLHERQPTAGLDAQALQVAERSRARSLLDLLAEAKATVRQGIAPEYLARERDLQSRLATLADRLTRLIVRNAPEAEQKALRTEIASTAEALERVHREIRERHPQYAALTQPTPPTVADIQQQCLDAATAMVVYHVGETRSYAWVVTPHSLHSFALLPGATINAAARAFWRACRQPTTDPTTDGQALTRLILAPLGPVRNIKRLVIIPDEGLHYVPFAALPDPTRPGHYLIEAHEIVSIPSVTALLAHRQPSAHRPAPSGELAVLADPVFDVDDPRLNSRLRLPPGDAQRRVAQRREIGLKVTEARLEQAAQHVGLLAQDMAGDTIPRLPATRREAESISALLPRSKRLRITDFEANRDALLTGDATKYRILHIASHGLMDSERPELSGLLLSRFDVNGQPREGVVGLADIFNLPLASELVVLSACQTGLGTYVRGEGLVGLTRGFMYAGATQVVVSLWSISDQATARLMTDFYRALLREKRRPADALRVAQLTMLRDTKTRHPFFWAAFQLHGEW